MDNMQNLSLPPELFIVIVHL